MNSSRLFFDGEVVMKPDKDGKKNICGARIREFRKALPGNVSQRQLAEQITDMGLKMNERTIRNIENGNRYIYDTEQVYFAKVLGISYKDLVDN